MVALHALCSLCTALNNVGVDCTLAKEVDAVELACLLLEYADELCADNLALLLWVCNVLELAEETVCSVYIYKVCAKLVAEDLYNGLALALTHQAVVNVNANKVLADSLEKEGCYNRAVNSA